LAAASSAANTGSLAASANTYITGSLAASTNAYNAISLLASTNTYITGSLGASANKYTTELAASTNTYNAELAASASTYNDKLAASASTYNDKLAASASTYNDKLAASASTYNASLAASANIYNTGSLAASTNTYNIGLLSSLITSLNASSPHTQLNFDSNLWYLKYYYNTTSRNSNHVLPATLYNPTILNSNIKRIAYYMQNNNIYAWVSFDYDPTTMPHYEVPSTNANGNLFVNTCRIYNVNIISNSPNIQNVKNVNGYLQVAPSFYSGRQINGTTQFGMNNLNLVATLGHGAFNIWNYDTENCIFGWNNQNYDNGLPNIGFGNGTPQKDWTFANTTPVNFAFLIFALPK
jgi:hypothetical protein